MWLINIRFMFDIKNSNNINYFDDLICNFLKSVRYKEFRLYYKPTIFRNINLLTFSLLQISLSYLYYI